ncbi:hypothetical protein [Azospirillum sp. TSH64]|uniref:hypothetical protein n=1 Tax=Azospirillum sp. TSH64 TaxID=652740 RepID=UPI0011B21620|nr:hypothetical protein [Azospirillum sp. TSH64]
MSNVLVTCCNSAYYESCLLLISTVHSTSDSTIDRILVYNLGLSGEQVDLLNRCHKVQVVEFPAWLSDIYPEFLTPKQYAWKTFVIKDAASYGDNIFYLDSGAMLVRDIKDIYEKIEQNHIFVVGDSHKNRTWTHDLCFRIMGASEEEKNANQICAGIQGYKPNGRFQRYVDEGFLYACIKSAIFGDHKNHRHDQSIYSVLVKRYGIEHEDIDIYGEWKGILRPNQAIYVHRRYFPVSKIHLKMKG